LNKKEYLAKLRMYLQGLAISELEDIISDYEEHFNIGISKGKSEEEISRELGDPKEVANSYMNNLEDSYETDLNDGSRKSKVFKWIAIAAGTLILIFVISLIAFHDNFLFYPSSGIVSINSKGNKVRVGANGIEVKYGDNYVIVGWDGIKVKDGTDEVSLGWNGLNIKNSIKNSIKFNGLNFSGIKDEDLRWEEVDEERLAPIDEVKNISVSSPFVDIKIITEDRKDLKVHYHGRMKTNVVPKLHVEGKNSNLTIELKLEKGSYSVNNSNVVLELFIPKSFNGTISSTASSGDIYAKEIIGESFNFATISGDIVLEKLEGKNINITTSSGDISLVNLIGNLNIASSSGNVKTSNLSGNLTINTSSGDIALEDVTSEDIKISSSSGDIVLNLNDTANYYITGSSSSGKFIPNNKMLVEENQKGRFKASIGKGLYSMEIKTSSGDVIFK